MKWSSHKNSRPVPTPFPAFPEVEWALPLARRREFYARTMPGGRRCSVPHTALFIAPHTSNNPVNSIDPTGHRPTDPECGNQEEDCGGSVNHSKVTPIVAQRNETVVVPDDSNQTDRGKNDLRKNVLIGSFSGYEPYIPQDSYDSGCGGCSAEPPAPYIALDPFTAILLAYGTYTSINSLAAKSNVSVYLNYTLEYKGYISIPSLTVNNQSGTDLSIQSIIFTQSGRKYSIGQSEVMSNAGDFGSLRAGGNRKLVTDINLIPSGNSFNSTNTFSIWNEISVSVAFASRRTGYNFPLVSKKFYPYQLGR
jgi:hypothetical protein